MIGRIWHGYTTPENADIYENLLKTEIFKGIAAMEIGGFKGIKLFRRPIMENEREKEVEFITIMEFDSLDDVQQFAGQDYEKAYVPVEARKILLRFDQKSQHYEIREQVLVSH